MFLQSFYTVIQYQVFLSNANLCSSLYRLKYLSYYDICYHNIKTDTGFIVTNNP